jgi:hypothetical protein
VGAKRLDAIEVGNTHFAQGLDLFDTEVHVAQRCLVAFSQTTHRIHQDGSNQIRFFGPVHYI